MRLVPNILLRNGWRNSHILAAPAMMAFAVAASWDAWCDIVRMAMHQGAFTHIYLVPFAVIALAWVRRGRLRFCEPGGGGVGVMLIAIGWLASAIGYQGAIESLWHGGAVLMVIGAVVSMLGRDIFMAFLPALVAMLFLVPLPGIVRDNIDAPFTSGINWATCLLLGLTGDAVMSRGEGAVLLVALLFVSYTFAFCLPLRTYVRFAVVMSSPISAMLCGLIYAAPTAWLRDRYPTMADNVAWISAPLTLAAAVAMLVGLVRMMRWAMLPLTRFTLAHD